MIKIFLTINLFPHVYPSLTNVSEVYSSVWMII